MTEQQIKDGFDRLEGAIAPPLDSLERVDRRVRVRRRRRRTGIAGAVVLAVVASAGAAVALSGGDEEGGDLVAVDPPQGPTSTLVLTRPDGSTYAFDDVTVSCQPPETPGGDPISYRPGRIWAFSPIKLERWVDHEDDAVATQPFVYFEGIVSKLAGDRTFTFPNDWNMRSDEYPMVLFVADTDRNEAASSAGGESGTVRVLEASCDPEPVLRLEVDMTLGSEVGKSTLDIAGALH